MLQRIKFEIQRIKFEIQRTKLEIQRIKLKIQRIKMVIHDQLRRFAILCPLYASCLYITVSKLNDNVKKTRAVTSRYVNSWLLKDTLSPYITLSSYTFFLSVI